MKQPHISRNSHLGKGPVTPAPKLISPAVQSHDSWRDDIPSVFQLKGNARMVHLRAIT